MGIKGGGMGYVSRDESDRGVIYKKDISHKQCSINHVPRMPPENQSTYANCKILTHGIINLATNVSDVRKDSFPPFLL